MPAPSPVLFKISLGWDTKLFPDEMKTWNTRSQNTAHYSVFHDSTKNYAALNAFIAKAIAAYCKGAGSDYALVRIGQGAYAVEHEKNDGSTLLFRLDATGKCRGTIQEVSGRLAQIPTLDKNSAFDCTSMVLCLLMRTCEISQQVKDHLDNAVQRYASSGDFDPDDIYYISDAVYYANKSNQVKCTMTGGNIDMLNQSQITSGMLNGTVLCGSPKIITSAGQRATTTAKVTFGEAKKRFAQWADAQVWTEAEQRLIPVFPDDYPVMAETMKLCSRYVSTHADRRPMVNFLWRGITSYGKSTGVAMMAALLNMPLLRVTCNSSMETNDFLSNIVPCGDNGGREIAEELPSFQDMSLDPESAYYELTGEELPDATPQDCLNAYAEVVLSKAGKGSDRLFKQVKSPFVEALEHGYIVEVQEISRIKDSGVLVGLNEFDRPGAVIPLVDGGTVRRHPNAIVVYTDNVAYVSCRAVDPSVLRRMAFIIDSNEVSKEDALERVIYNTGFEDADMLDTMYEVWDKIKSHCADKDITEGTVSLTELEMWAQCMIVDGYDAGVLRSNCIDCVVSKATSVPEEQAEILSAVVDLTLAA